MPDEPIHLGGAADFVEIRCLERGGEATPDTGDVRLGVAVASGGFAGSNDRVWVAAGEWRRFVGSLRRLEVERTGRAGVESMSPDEFRLDLTTVDRAGHLEASGHLSRYHFGRYAGTPRSRIEFGFGVDPSLLREWVDAIATLQCPDTGSEPFSGERLDT